MNFYNGDDLCMIKGKMDDSVDIFDSTRLDKLLNKRYATASIHLYSMLVDASPSSPPVHIWDNQDEVVTTLLAEFSDIFTPPTFLPTKRSCDHTIDLLHGSGPFFLAYI